MPLEGNNYPEGELQSVASASKLTIKAQLAPGDQQC